MLMTSHLTPSSYALCRRLFAALCLLSLAACSSLNSMMGGTSEQDALRALQWRYAKDGVQIVVQADPHLNQSGNEPHNLVLAVMQLADPTAYAAATASSDKLSSLLLATSPPSGMLALERLFISPGESRTITLPRVEKAQYIGLALGYYHLDPARSTRLYRIGVDIDSSGLLIKTRSAAPQTLTIDLRLGPDGIEASPDTPTPPVTLTKPTAGPVTPDGEPSAQSTPIHEPPISSQPIPSPSVPDAAPPSSTSPDPH